MPDSPESKEGESGLKRELGLFDSTMMMVGIVIGSGIFLITGIMANSLPSSGWILLAWVVGGLLTLAGALTYAELGAAMPQAGGQYVYLREAYGKLAGFLFGWVLYLVAMGGAIAAAAVGFATYLGYFFPTFSTSNILFFATLPGGIDYTLSAGQIVAALTIIGLSIINLVGVGLGKAVQNLFAVVKIGTIIAFIFFGLVLSGGGGLELSFETTMPPSATSGSLIVGFGLALVAVSWTFDGWHNVSYVAGEIRNPKRNLPLTLVMGTFLITALYFLMNVVYLIALPVDEMRGVSRIAEQAAGSLFGATSAGLISSAVLIATFGSLNGAIFVGARVYYAMAKDGVFFKRAANVHPRFKTPAFAISIQAVWCVLLALSGSYEQLFTYVTFISLIFWISGTASVFVLRYKRPDLPRPYKTWGYPVVPLLFLLALFGILINTLINRPVESLLGLGFALVGLPVYFYWTRSKAPMR